jgi:hypothetical protein
LIRAKPPDGRHQAMCANAQTVADVPTLRYRMSNHRVRAAGKMEKQRPA